MNDRSWLDVPEKAPRHQELLLFVLRHTSLERLKYHAMHEPLFSYAVDAAATAAPAGAYLNPARLRNSLKPAVSGFNAPLPPPRDREVSGIEDVECLDGDSQSTGQPPPSGYISPPRQWRLLVSPTSVKWV